MAVCKNHDQIRHTLNKSSRQGEVATISRMKSYQRSIPQRISLQNTCLLEDFLLKYFEPTLW